MSTTAAPASPRRPRVLLLSPYFLPAEQGGGSVRAVQALTAALKDEFDFTVLARDHDLRSPTTYPEAARDAARRATGLDLRYLARGQAGRQVLHATLAEPFDLIYLQSLMAPDLALLPLLWARRRGTNAPPLLIAPRGELMPGALAQRPLAKRLYLALLRGLGLLARAQWHATQVEEAAAIERAVGARAHIAPDLPPPLADFPAPALTAHAPGPLRVLFLSRIDPVKNLGFAIDVLARVSRPVEFSIAGPIGNAAVWADCQARLQALPAHIQVRTLGPQSPDAVPPLLATQDLLFLPSLSENHGYVVQEALLCGCAVLLSDRTPWRQLQAAGVGADLPLNDPQAFVAWLDALDPDALAATRPQCRAYAEHALAASPAVAQTRDLLRAALQPKARMPSSKAGQSAER
jgi:glycosyltransferase involved in cell wall biosynthesis